MGLYDMIDCRMPLPIPFDEDDDGLAQTQDTPRQWLDVYKIETDGSLWHLNYDVVEDHDPDHGGPADIGRVNLRWVPEPFDGPICFYGDNDADEWLEYRALFAAGRLVGEIERVGTEPA